MLIHDITPAVDQLDRTIAKEVKLKQLDERYQEVLDKKANTEAEKQEQLKKIEELEEEKKKLQEQLTLKLERQKQAELAKAKLSKEAKQVAGVGSAKAQGSCNTGNQYKDYIYFRESGCRTDAVNPIGCKGIGQACPASKIAHCGNDFACQDEWFSNYAQTRYNGWEQAYNLFVGKRSLLEEIGSRRLLTELPCVLLDRKSTRLNSSHRSLSRMPSSA